MTDAHAPIKPAARFAAPRRAASRGRATTIGGDADRHSDPVLPRSRLGRDIVSDAAAAESREWLVTNGIGGYASSSLTGMPTRGYHGLLVAALAPPLGRTLKLVTLLETVEAQGERFELATLRWRGGMVAPSGQVWLDSVRFEGTTPVWRFATPRFVLEKRLTMDHGANVTRVDYSVIWCAAPLRLEIGVVADHRDYHSRSFGNDAVPDIFAEGEVLRVAAPNGRDDETLHVRLAGGAARAAGTWYRGFDLAQERLRGLTDAEDHVYAGKLAVNLAGGGTVQLAAGIGSAPQVDAGAAAAAAARQGGLLRAWQAARGPEAAPAPDWIARLVLAADQFLVGRRLRNGSEGASVIAGYHWFSDWGRDTMISLPGLTIETGRPALARSVLSAFADAVDGGMIPNRFPDAGDAPEFNTVDATLWFFEALAAYHAATGDDAFIEQIFSVLEGIVAAHRAGTRYGIAVDPADGLIRAGEPGVQLTWMDARVGDWVVTPRIGKPVEVNALWISALRTMERAAARLGRPADAYAALREAAVAGFGRFWNPERGHLFDVIDGPEGDDPLLRPNQILAARPGVGALTSEQARGVVDACQRALLTPAGLRSLAADDPGYLPHYGGDQRARDAAYHMGTVWAWLIGPFVEAHLAVHGDAARAEAILAPLGDQLRMHGMGTLSEIFEAAPPHAPRGCIAQAWSVAEVLRAWHLIDRHRAGPAKSAISGSRDKR